MKFNVITIFPDLIKNYTDESILGRAQKNKIIKVRAINLRDFTVDRHHTIDDTPYGGGAGMVMKPEPLYKTLKSLDAIPFAKAGGLTKIKKLFGVLVGNSSTSFRTRKRTILLSPRGRQYPQYTKPADFRGWKVPEILLSGDHKKIDEWRKSLRKKIQ